MYHSTGVVRNSRTARRDSASSATCAMKPLWVSSCSARGPIASWEDQGVTARPTVIAARVMLTVSGLRSGRGIRSGAPIEEKVSPGTPPTAYRPVTRSGWRTATSNIVLTPIDQPISTAASMPASSITAIASSAKASMPTRSRSAGRSEPPVPRWFQDTTRTPQPGSSSDGQA